MFLDFSKFALIKIPARIISELLLTMIQGPPDIPLSAPAVVDISLILY